MSKFKYIVYQLKISEDGDIKYPDTVYLFPLRIENLWDYNSKFWKNNSYEYIRWSLNLKMIYMI